MIETLSIRKLEEKATNIYEAIIVLAKRSRQVNSDQKQMLAAERDYEEDFGGYGEEEFEPNYDADYEELPKPTAVALEEFLNDKISHKYPDADSEEEEKEGGPQ